VIQQWCDRTHLSFNPQKMVIVPFTRRRDLRGLNEPTLLGHALQLTTKVKYLGFILEGNWHGRNIWKMWWLKPTGLFGTVMAHLVKPEVWNTEWCIASTRWSDLYWPIAPGLVAEGQMQCQQDKEQ